MQWDNTDGWDYRVVSSTGWRNLVSFDAEERAGVYLFADSNLNIKYVGKAGARRMGNEVQSAMDRGKARGAMKVRIFYTNSDARALELEKMLIFKYQPPNNY